MWPGHFTKGTSIPLAKCLVRLHCNTIHTVKMRMLFYLYSKIMYAINIQIFVDNSISLSQEDGERESPARLYSSATSRSSLPLSLLIVPEAVVCGHAVTDGVRLWQGEADGVSADVTGDLPQSLRTRTLGAFHPVDRCCGLLRLLGGFVMTHC